MYHFFLLSFLIPFFVNAMSQEKCERSYQKIVAKWDHSLELAELAQHFIPEQKEVALSFLDQAISSCQQAKTDFETLSIHLRHPHRSVKEWVAYMRVLLTHHKGGNWVAQTKKHCKKNKKKSSAKIQQLQKIRQQLAETVSMETVYQNLEQHPVPSWIKTQLDHEFAPFKERSVSLDAINAFYEEKASDFYLVKFTILDNQVFIDSKIAKGNALYVRVAHYQSALQKLASLSLLPNMVFLISIADGLAVSDVLQGVPVFAMCKHKGGNNGILIPDFDAIANRFQVIQGRDIAQLLIPWDSKEAKLIWRGSTAYGGLWQTQSNLSENVRVKLCQYSTECPELIDAKFTWLAQGGETVPSLKQLCGEYVSFERQLGFKYHMLIDGNTSSYSASGWKFFTNSLIFKQESPWTQWYYSGLEPWVHYVPVKADLSDFIEKIQWARTHDAEAQAIAWRARGFAREHISELSNLTYFYHALLRYHRLLNLSQ